MLRDELRVLIEPGAPAAIGLLLLIMAAGDIAMAVAGRGWPF